MGEKPIEGENRITFGVATHIGASPQRTLLEDRVRANKIKTREEQTIFLGVVADGIGGENAGERAAEITVNAIFSALERAAGDNIPRLLEEALREANRRVYAEARRSRRKANMGSTAAVAAIVNHKLYLANVGDSRIYLLRGKKATCLTIDHSWENEVVRSGKLSPEEARRHPRKDEITRSIGYQPQLDVDLGVWIKGGQESDASARTRQGMALQPGDRIILCSDGLTKTRHDNWRDHYVAEEEFHKLIRGKSPKQAAQALLQRALSRGVDDNVSVAVLEVSDGKEWLHRAAAIAGLFAALLVVAGAGYWMLANRLNGSSSSAVSPTIPALPKGVAFVSALEGAVEVSSPGGGLRPLELEDIIPVGPGVRVITRGERAFVRLGLADESIVNLGPESQLEINAIADPIAGGDTILILEQGSVLVEIAGTDDFQCIVESLSKAAANAKGSIIGVSYDEQRGEFHLDCFKERCELLFDDKVVLSLEAGEHAWLTADGTVFGPDIARNDLYAFAGMDEEGLQGPMVLVGSTSLPLSATPTSTLFGPLFSPPTATPVSEIKKKPAQAPTKTSTPKPIPTRTRAPTKTSTPKPSPTRTRAPTPIPTRAPTETQIKLATPTKKADSTPTE